MVKEESTGTTWEAYILTDEEGKEITEVSKSAKDAENGVLTLPEMHNHLTVTHTFTKNWANAGDSNLTWENIGVKEMDVTGTLYVGVMENGTLTGTMTNAMRKKTTSLRNPRPSMSVLKVRSSSKISRLYKRTRMIPPTSLSMW